MKVLMLSWLVFVAPVYIQAECAWMLHLSPQERAHPGPSPLFDAYLIHTACASSGPFCATCRRIWIERLMICLA